ncbi:phage major capsid protein [Neisseria subflava]|uniref:phage major capsid protein n=1 Tax=Neisseria subflava TaxID=28449 RepID=UPI000D5008D9|nr:phage major capsid protein [Neisseria subflava]
MKKSMIARGLIAAFADAGNTAPDVGALLAELNSSFAAFKDSKEKEIAALQQGSEEAKASSAKAEAEISKLQASIDDLAVQMAASQMNGGAGKLDKEAQAAVDATVLFMKSGEVRADLKKSDDSNGGYLVPKEWDRTITDRLRAVSPLRKLFKVQPTSKPKFSRLYNMHGAGSGWVGEEAARAKTNTPTFKSLDFETGEIYANPAATQQMLDDAEINLEAFLADEVKTEFSVSESQAFISGDGQNGKPNGLLTYAEGGTNATKHPFGAIKVVKSGNAASVTADSIIDLVYSLPAEFSQGACFMMNRKTLAAVRKLKDGQGNYLWQPSYQQDQPSTLCGYPVYEVADMPDVAANALCIAFGDFKRAYMILDRKGVSILRDPYTNKPFVQFYTTKRVGGGVDNPEACVLLKVAA